MDVAGAESSQLHGVPTPVTSASPCPVPWLQTQTLGLSSCQTCRGPRRPRPPLTALGREGRGSSPRLSRQKREDEEGAPTAPVPAGPRVLTKRVLAHLSSRSRYYPRCPGDKAGVSPRRPGARPVRCPPCSCGVHRLKPYLSFKTSSNVPLPVNRVTRHTG